MKRNTDTLDTTSLVTEVATTENDVIDHHHRRNNTIDKEDVGNARDPLKITDNNNKEIVANLGHRHILPQDDTIITTRNRDAITTPMSRGIRNDVTVMTASAIGLTKEKRTGVQ